MSHIPKKGKRVLLISALHNDNKTYLDNRDKFRLEIDIFCNSTKGDVDSAGKKCAAYNIQTNFHRSVTSIVTTNVIVIYSCQIFSVLLCLESTVVSLRAKKMTTNELFQTNLKRTNGLNSPETACLSFRSKKGG